MKNMKSIWKYSFKALLIAVFSVVACSHADAKTVTDSYNYLDTNSLNYYQNVYMREDYKYSILTSEYVNLGSYNTVTYYYLCLTNTEVDVSNTSNVNATCDKLYQYYRQNNVYHVEKLEDSNLSINDSLYYYQDSKHYVNYTFLFIIAIFVVALFLFLVIKSILRC